MPDIDLGLCPSLENMEQLAGQTISGLRQAHETRALQKILRQSVSAAPIATGNLFISGDKAVKSLRMVYERKLLQKLTILEKSFALADKQELFHYASAAQCNLILAHDINFVADLAKEPFGLRVPNLGRLNEETKRVFPAIRMAADCRQMEQLKWIFPDLKTPSLQILASKAKTACASLKIANDFMILRQLNRTMVSFNLPNAPTLWATSRIVLKKLKRAHETKIMNKIYIAERERAKIIKNCYFHADWAGSDLQRWDGVFAEYEKSPKKFKILNELIDEAHIQFLMIMVESRKMPEIEKRCIGNPFLLREFEILHNEVEKYYQQKRDKEEKQILPLSSFYLGK